MYTRALQSSCWHRLLYMCPHSIMYVSSYSAYMCSQVLSSHFKIIARMLTYADVCYVYIHRC